MVMMSRECKDLYNQQPLKNFILLFIDTVSCHACKHVSVSPVKAPCMELQVKSSNEVSFKSICASHTLCQCKYRWKV